LIYEGIYIALHYQNSKFLIWKQNVKIEFSSNNYIKKNNADFNVK